MASLYCAVDTPDRDAALALARQLAGVVDGLKLGLEFFVANGPDGVRALAALGLPLFLDLKLHDIPNTVAGAAQAAAALGPAVMTLHASGGPAMLRAAAAAARQGAAAAGCAPPRLVAVTVLTSLGDADLTAVGQAVPAAAQVERLAAVTREAGLDGVVCSAHEVALLRRAWPEGFLVVPGLRPAWADAQDQKRAATPAEAVAAGADLLVIGRPITQAADPAGAARRIREELGANSGVQGR